MTEVDEDYARYPIGKEKETRKLETLVESDSDQDSDKDDEKKDFISSEANIESKKDPKTRTTIRNLRIREDTASYLKDITENSTTQYDPKSRRTKDVSGIVDESSEFTRATNDATQFTDVQRYAWEAYEKGQDIHLFGAPSQAELAFREYQGKKEVLTKEQRDAILARYGGKEHLEKPKELLVSQSDHFVTYNPDGTIARGQEKMPAIPRSKYEEDVFINNHTSVWGSYWENGQWGYACCAQFVKNSYCIGKSGIAAKEKFQQDMQERTVERTDGEESTPQKTEDKKPPKSEQRRKYNSVDTDVGVTPEEIEAYKKKRQRAEDPMANFANKEFK